VVEVRDLTVVLGGQKVLNVPSFRVNSDEVLVIIGPNGSGKTTLLLCLALLIKPTTGVVSYAGSPALGSTALSLRRQIAVVFQDPFLLNRSVRDNVNLGLRLHGIRGKEMHRRTAKWLERFGVANLADRQARTLSGGEAKRVSLARAFALEPRMLYLDEPFNALDTPTRQSLLEDFESVLRETKMTTVMVTHDHNEAVALADRLGVLMKGGVRQIGTAVEVFDCPVDEEVASFIEAGNILHGEVRSQSAGLVSVNVHDRQLYAVSDLRPGTAVTVFVHHEDVTLSVGMPGTMSSSARNQLAGPIVKVFPLGPQIKVTVDCGFNLSSVITRRSWEELGLEVGREVVASFKASSVRLIPKSQMTRESDRL
jgi:tungstate transport system ATP-binding protein